MAGISRKRRNGKPGPKRDPDLMELAVHLRLRGWPWAKVSKGVGAAVSTLMEWKDTDEWAAIRDRLATGRADKLTHLSFEVLAQKLARELARRNPDTTLAERLWERSTPRPVGDDDVPPGPGGVGVMRHIVELPSMDRGHESKPATQVLIAPTAQPAPPAAPPPAPAPGRKARTKPAPRKRTVAGPDE